MTSETRTVDELANAIDASGTRTGSATGKPPEAPRRPLIDCGDLGIRIARDGTWFYHGSPIGRKPLVRLFATVLRREADDQFYLVTPVERGRIVVDDAPFVAVEVTCEGTGTDQHLRFRTNVDDEVCAGSAHPIRVATNVATGEPAPYVLIRPGLEALITRSAYYELVAMSEAAPDGSADLGVWSGGMFFRLGRP
ncbi:MAG: DUF1285 domain-containing protein [Alphaproteobacteria bacterium]|nr:DUF1285 domain-containing protein [Alphaproteobacteria bacterium]